MRDTSTHEQNILADLRDGEQPARSLQARYGTRYVGLIRKLKMKGHPIWKTTIQGEVLYRLDEEGYAATKCRLCGRLFSAAPDTITAERKECPDCLAGEGILSTIRRKSEG